jgi:hypothetical protein
MNCPRCGATNPADNRFCGKCGQVLSAAAMLDHSPPPDADLPDWLRESADDAKSSLSATPPTATPPAGASELPAWLSEISLEDERQPVPETTQAPDWLAQLQSAPSASSGAEELPAWLRSNDPTSSASAPSTAEQLPDWLRDLEPPTAQPPAAPAPSQELPWQPTERPAATTTPASTEQLPDWLRELETEAPPPSPSVPAADELPAWLREDTPVPAEAADGASGRSKDLPGWLKEFGVEDDPVPPQAVDASRVAGTMPSVPQETPSWLADFDTSPPATTPPPPAIDDVPPWLRDEAPVKDAPQAARTETPELPAWLREENTADAGTQDLNVPLPDWSSEFGAELPPQSGQDQPGLDWLREPEPASGSAPTASSTPFVSGSASNDLPDWLSEIETPAASAAPPANTSDSLPPWLAEESPTAAPPAVPAASPAPSDELPAWLLDVDSAAPTQSPASEALPSWLDDNSAGQPTRPLPTNDPGATQALPAWLLDEPSATPGAAQPIAEQPSGTADLPSWLAIDEPAAPATYSSTPPSDELPAWLSVADEPGTTAQPVDRVSEELPPWLSAGSSAESGAAAGSTTSSDELPAWLAGDEPASATSASPAPATDDLPPWLAEDDRTSGQPEPQQPAAQQSADTVAFPAWLTDTAAEQPARSEATSDADLPPWLSGIEAESPAKTEEPASGLPAWLDEPAQAVRPAPPKQAGGQSEFLGGLDLPAWLREEGGEQQAAAPVKAAAPEWLQKIAPETDDHVQPQHVVAAPTAPRVVRTPERVESMRLLEQMLDAPAPEPVPAPTRRRRSWLPLLLGLILLLLIGAILFILLNPRLGLSFGTEAAPLPAAVAASQTIDGLAAQRPVVLAYEWDAQRLGDLRPLEESVTAHLATRRDVPLVFLSTDPQGAMLAAERAEQISRVNDNFHDQYGLGYVNLGFKAGGTIALRQFAANNAFGALFAQDASGNDLRANDVVMQSMCGAASAEGCDWSDVGLLILMADEVEDVRGWFEQLRSQQPNLPVLVLGSAEIAPQVTPYVAAGTQMLAGAGAAEAYSRARGVQDERLGRQSDAIAVGSALFGLLILLGGPIAAFQGYRTRREAEVEEWER